jgi:hypothetical protein
MGERPHKKKLISLTHVSILYRAGVRRSTFRLQKEKVALALTVDLSLGNVADQTPKKLAPKDISDLQPLVSSSIRCRVTEHPDVEDRTPLSRFRNLYEHIRETSRHECTSTKLT